MAETEAAPDISIDIEPPGFNLFRLTDSELYDRINTKIQAGELPRETMLRLGCIGHSQRDTEGTYLMRAILMDADANTNEPEKMGETTQAILFGDLPDALLDWNGNEFVTYLNGKKKNVLSEGSSCRNDPAQA